MFGMVIMTGRRRCIELMHVEPSVVYLPLTQMHLDWLLTNVLSFQVAMEDYTGRISIRFPSHKLLTMLQTVPLLPRSKYSLTPVDGITVFTDGSGKTGKAVIVWENKIGQWESDVQQVRGSPQVVELHVIVRVFEKWDEPLNIITDSQYVEGVVQRLEGAWLKSIDHEDLYLLFRQLQHLINNRKHPYHIMHIRSHTQLPSPIAEGNALADTLAAPVIHAPLPDALQQARLSHAFYHQYAKSLQRMFHIPLDSARQLTKTCPDCQSIAPLHPVGVNP